MITQSINLNLIPGAVPPRIKVSQYDEGSRTLQFTLFNGTSPFTTASLSAVIQGTKPDNHGFSYDATYAAGVVTADITKQMTACAGAVTCELVIEDASHNKLGTGNFILDVEPSALSEDTDISDTEIPAIIDAAEANAERAEAAAAIAEAADLHPPYIGENEHWYVWDTVQEQFVDSGVDAEGVDGVGIVSIAKTGTVGLVDTYTITLSNGQTQTFTVTNGAAAVLPAGGTAQQVLMKNSSTDSDASWKDINTTASYKDMQAALGAPAGAGKNLLDVSIADLKSSNTSGTWNGNTYTHNGVNFAVSVDSKGLVTTVDFSTESGGATANAYLNMYGVKVTAGNIISGCPEDGSGSTYSIVACSRNGQTVYAADLGEGASISTSDDDGRIILRVLTGTVATTAKTFYPMIRPSGTSADYVPHSDSLQAQVDGKADDADIAPIENGTTASRTYKKGQHFWRDGDFCVVTASISQGAAFTLNTNYTISNVGESIDGMSALLPIVDFSTKTALSNANTAVDSGWYRLNDGATGSPYSGYGCYLLVLRMSSYCTQICFPNAKGATGGTVYPPKIRHGWPAESQWTDWKTFTIS